MLSTDKQATCGVSLWNSPAPHRATGGGRVPAPRSLQLKGVTQGEVVKITEALLLPARGDVSNPTRAWEREVRVWKGSSQNPTGAKLPPRGFQAGKGSGASAHPAFADDNNTACAVGGSVASSGRGEPCCRAGLGQPSLLREPATGVLTLSGAKGSVALQRALQC